MLYYDAKKISPLQNYKFLTGAVAPRPIAWITTKNPETGVINAAPFSYFTVAASQTPLVVISINRRNGQLKDTAANLLRSRAGAIHIVSERDLTVMNQTAATLPPDVSELELIDYEQTASTLIDVPALAQPLIRMETTLHQYLPIEDAGQVLSDLFVLQVENYHFAEEIFDQEKEYILSEKLQPVSRLAGNHYGMLGAVVDVARPY